MQSEESFDERLSRLTDEYTIAELRSEIDGIVGIDSTRREGKIVSDCSFTKRELAQVLLALGGPR